jgi:hypothetical protein
MGYDSFKLKNLIKNEDWIIDIKDGYENVENDEIITISESFLKRVAF